MIATVDYGMGSVTFDVVSVRQSTESMPWVGKSGILEYIPGETSILVDVSQAQSLCGEFGGIGAWLDANDQLASLVIERDGERVLTISGRLAMINDHSFAIMDAKLPRPV
jgi:hypothetical protein